MTKSYKWWNKLDRDFNTDVTAEKGDTALLINGVAFLIQRRNDFNNVICIRIKPFNKPILKTFETFRRYCQRKKIQYIRIEGIGKHTYKLLYLVLRKAPSDANVLYADEESEKYNRHIYFVKTY